MTIQHRYLPPVNLSKLNKTLVSSLSNLESSSSQEQVSKMSYNEKSDIWSLGCLLYELCALHPPFLAMDQHSLAIKIRDGKFKPLPSHFSEELGEFIKWMLQVNVSYTSHDLTSVP